MSTRLFALLFTALFIIGAIPVFFLQPFGFAGAGVSAGFTMPIDDFFRLFLLVTVGVFSACAAEEVILLMPLSVLLMIALGALMEIPVQDFHPVQNFIAGGILLFALCVSLLRSKSILLYLMPFGWWSYFIGGDYMRRVPPETSPLYFLIGVMLSAALLLAIGVAMGITVSDRVKAGVSRFKSSQAYASFMSIF